MEARTTVASLHDDLLLLAFSALDDAKDQARAMLVCRLWRNLASLIPHVSVAIPEAPSSYEGKILAIQERLRCFPRVTTARVTIGKPKPVAGDSSRRCMRYAELGLAVDKFLFLAAKSANSSFFFDPSMTASLENDQSSQFHAACTATETTGALPQTEEGQGRAGRQPAVNLPLKHVMGPTDRSLRVMMPVIVFAIIRGFDELLQALPPLVSHSNSLENLLIVDLSDSVTFNIRKHHIEQMRALPATLANPLGPDSAGPCSQKMLSSSGFVNCAHALAPEESRKHSSDAGADPTCDVPVGAPRMVDESEGTSAPLPSEASQLNGLGGAVRDDSEGAIVHAEVQENSTASPASALVGLSYDAPVTAATNSTILQDPLLSTQERRHAQMLESSQSSDLDISFWRADEATAGSWKVRDISVCIASNRSLPLSDDEMDLLVHNAFGGRILEATMRFVNDSRGTRFL